MLLDIAEENDLEIDLSYALKNMPMAQSGVLIVQHPEILDASLEYLLFRRSSDDLKMLAERLPDSPGEFRGFQ